jgi:hypothetical protein
MRTASRSALVAATCLVAALLACKKTEQPSEATPSSAPAPTAAAPAPTPAPAATGVAVGAAVKAPWGRTKTMYPGKVAEIYGKLGFVKFDDGDSGWALLSDLQPAGTPGPDPTGDSCAFKVDAKVSAPWGSARTMYPGKVTEAYGKLASVTFDDGDHGWEPCADLKAR